MADASWGERNIYACLVMMNNGVIITETKKMGPVDSSVEAEGIATSKCDEILENVREIARGMGILPDEPTVIRCDNLASVRVSNDPKSAGRLRHAQRRFATLQARVARGDVTVVHVPDVSNAADFMTKWIPVAKLNESIAFASNVAAKKQDAGQRERRPRPRVRPRGLRGRDRVGLHDVALGQEEALAHDRQGGCLGRPPLARRGAAAGACWPSRALR